MNKTLSILGWGFTTAALVFWGIYFMAGPAVDLLRDLPILIGTLCIVFSSILALRQFTKMPRGVLCGLTIGTSPLSTIFCLYLTDLCIRLSIVPETENVFLLPLPFGVLAGIYIWIFLWLCFRKW